MAKYLIARDDKLTGRKGLMGVLRIDNEVKPRCRRSSRAASHLALLDSASSRLWTSILSSRSTVRRSDHPSFHLTRLSSYGDGWTQACRTQPRRSSEPEHDLKLSSVGVRHLR